ncbi:MULTISPECIES: hypothetical protein [Streptomyces]|uniref:Secreted protein n=1 Tax=Streptomyces solicathayae TaxID=3081768 RepID=A0ABZ0LQD6_9ACTN|nr:hypothetical protein [Streptomyces sp. HUAS YS2]WOX21426.1 hypothetical protein R2D22_08480 [Streptomyces sp. HUAS YS2]
MTMRIRLRSATAALATAAVLVLTAQTAVAAPQGVGRWDMPNGILWAESAPDHVDVGYQRTGDGTRVSIGWVDNEGERRSHTETLLTGRSMAFSWDRGALSGPCVTVFVQFTFTRESFELCD